MKIIHTGDLHLKKLYKGKLPLEVSNKLLEDAWRALFEVFEFSNEVEADITSIVFVGEYEDLLPYKLKFLDLVRNVKAKIFIAFGNHDYLSEDNLFLKVDLPENLYIFKNNLDYFELSELKTRIYGISYDSYAFNKNFGDLDLDEEFINIGLFHSDLKDERYLPLSKDFLQKFNYVALGHIHKRGKVYDNAYYSGSLIPLSFKDEGKRGIIYLDDEKKSFEFKNFSKREFINLEINLNKEMTFSDILESIQENIYQDNLYRIRLRGETKHPEDLENFLRENLNAFYFEILNELYDIEEDFEIEDKYILEFLNSFGSSKTQMDAKELSKKYILEQYYDI